MVTKMLNTNNFSSQYDELVDMTSEKPSPSSHCDILLTAEQVKHMLSAVSVGPAPIKPTTSDPTMTSKPTTSVQTMTSSIDQTTTTAVEWPMSSATEMTSSTMTTTSTRSSVKKRRKRKISADQALRWSFPIVFKFDGTHCEPTLSRRLQQQYLYFFVP